MNIQSTQKKSSKKSFAIIVSIVALLLVGAGTAYAIVQSQSTPSAEEKAAQEVPYKSESPDATDESVKEDTPEYDGAPSGDSTDVTMEASQQGTNVVVQTKLHGYSDGTCSLKITDGTLSNTVEAPVLFQPEYSSCAGFTIPTAEYATGTWNLELSVVSKGTTITKLKSLNVK